MLLKLLLRILKNPDENIYLIIIDFLIEENRIIKNKYKATGKRLVFNDEERRSLAQLGHTLIKAGFKDYITLVKPDTLMKWYRRLVAKSANAVTTLI
jgi:putative transposase